MRKRLANLTREVRWKIHFFAMGMTLALGAPLLGQGCTAAGQ
jgi:hypothetical protein